MGQGDNFKRNNLPTIQQIRYLIELKKNNSQRGSISKIAQVCNVQHSSVSRYFKICIEKGYLTDKYAFTSKGMHWLNGYVKLLKELVIYLRRIGVPKIEIKNKLKDMIENIDYYTLTCMVKDNVQFNRCINSNTDVPSDTLKNILEYGNYDVYFMIYDIDIEKSNKISSLNKGFNKIAVLKNNKRGSNIIFQLNEITIKSRIDNTLVDGYINSFKYEKDNILYDVKIIDNLVKVPLSAFEFHKMKGGEMKGILKISVSFSVGREHIQDNTSLLMIWL